MPFEHFIQNTYFHCFVYIPNFPDTKIDQKPTDLVRALTKKAGAFSPAHITGFFQICDQPKDPLQKGSRGAGVSLTSGVTTEVQAKQSIRKSLQIRINGKIAESPDVSQTVADAFLRLAKASYQISIEHHVEVPMGCGFGASGACALSLALALNQALGLEFTFIEAAQIAHIAEIKCKTGLGTVIAETFGGAEIRAKPGAPGVGEIKSIKIDDRYVAASVCFGPLSTRKALTDAKLRKLINNSGGKLTDELVGQPTVPNFLKFSRIFAESTELMSERVRKVLSETDSHGFNCSMAMFGDTVFSLVKQDEAEELLKIFQKHVQSDEAIATAEIDFKGARIIQ